jgi:hypothetical protein
MQEAARRGIKLIRLTILYTSWRKDPCSLDGYAPEGYGIRLNCMHGASLMEVIMRVVCFRLRVVGFIREFRHIM